MRMQRIHWPPIRTYLACLLLCLCPAFLLAQKKASNRPIVESTWQLDATVNGVAFYHKIAECNQKKVVFLRLNNTNGYEVNVTWKEVFTTQDGTQLEGEQGQKQVLMPTGEILEVKCENVSHKEFVILPEQVSSTHVAQIAKFRFKDITVNKVR